MGRVQDKVTLITGGAGGLGGAAKAQASGNRSGRAGRCITRNAPGGRQSGG